MKQQRILSTVNINNQKITSNFQLKTWKSINYLKQIAVVNIPVSFNLIPKIGQDISISIFNKTIANGKIIRVDQNKQTIIVQFFYEPFQNSIYNETFEDIEISKIYQELYPKIKFYAKDTSLEQIIVKGSKLDSFNTICKKYHEITHHNLFYSWENDHISLRNTPQKSNPKEFHPNYAILEGSNIIIEPTMDMINMEIGDKLLFNNKKYIVLGITLDLNTVPKMIIYQNQTYSISQQ